MPDSLVGADFHLATDVGLDFAAEVALNLEVGFDVIAEGEHIFIGQVLGTQIRADAGRDKELKRTGAPDPKNVSKCDFHPLVAGEIDTGETCHLARFPSVLEEVSVANPPGRVCPGPGLSSGGATHR